MIIFELLKKRPATNAGTKKWRNQKIQKKSMGRMPKSLRVGQKKSFISHEKSFLFRCSCCINFFVELLYRMYMYCYHHRSRD